MHADTPIVDNTEDTGSMVEIRKFLFERSFDEVEAAAKEVVDEVEDEEPDEEEAAPSFSEADLQAARDEAFAGGREEGARDAATTTESQTQATLEAVAAHIEELFKREEEALESLSQDVLSVAVGIVRKVFPTLNQRHEMAEIERMVATAMERILDDPRIVVYVPPALAEPIRARLEPIAAETGYKGEIDVVPTDGMSPGDCRVEWTGGGARREMDEIWHEIDEIVERNLAKGPPAAAEDEIGEPLPAPEAAETETEAGEAAPDEPLPETEAAEAAPDEPLPEPEAAEPEADGEPAPEPDAAETQAEAGKPLPGPEADGEPAPDEPLPEPEGAEALPEPDAAETEADGEPAPEPDAAETETEGAETEPEAAEAAPDEPLPEPEAAETEAEPDVEPAPDDAILEGETDEAATPPAAGPDAEDATEAPEQAAAEPESEQPDDAPETPETPDAGDADKDREDG